MKKIEKVDTILDIEFKAICNGKLTKAQIKHNVHMIERAIINYGLGSNVKLSSYTIRKESNGIIFESSYPRHS